MDGVSRYLSIAYMVFAVAVSWLIAKTTALVLAAVSPRADIALFQTDLRLSLLIGIVAGLGLTWFVRNNPKSHVFATEVVGELVKVTWPTREETKSSTTVVIVLSIVLAIVLAVIDVIWKYTTDIIL